MCNEAVKVDPGLLKHVPDWSVTQEQTDAWHDDDYWYHDDEIIEWYEDHQKRKTQKAKKEKKLMPIVAGIPIVRWICVCQKTRRDNGSNR